jgi:hypothetical protein
MGKEFWIGTLLSIPIGVGTGLAVAPIQRFFRNRGDAKAIEESQRTREEYRRVLFFIEHPEMFTQYLVQVVIESAFIVLTMLLFFSIGGTLGMFAGAATANVAPHVITGVGSHYLAGALVILLEVWFVLYISLLIRLCQPAIIMLGHVRYFDRYVRRLPRGIRDLEAEKRLGGRIEMAKSLGLTSGPMRSFHL